VRVLSGATLLDLASFYAYPADFPGGVAVAASDFDGDNRHRHRHRSRTGWRTAF
jgi:hypothetical protein